MSSSKPVERRRYPAGVIIQSCMFGLCIGDVDSGISWIVTVTQKYNTESVLIC